jgi:L-amino acid N-acyltransferase YncA
MCAARSERPALHFSSALHRTLQGSVFPENAASLALVKRCGFREVGRRERIGCRNGVWRDTVLVERRSKVVGV